MVCYLLIHLGFNLEGYLLAEIVASILALLLSFKLILKILPNEMRSIFKNSKTAISKEERKFGNNMLILNIVGPLSSHADKITLAYFFTETEIGVNAICLSIIAFIPTVLISVNSIFAPIISELHTNKNNELLKYYYQNSSKYIFILTYPLIVFLAFFSENVMNIFGQDFLIGSNLLLLLLIGELFNISSGSVGIILNMCGFDTITRNVNVLCSTIVVFFYILLIPLYGLIGVGIGRLMYVVLLNGINLFYLKRKLNIHPISKSYVHQILAFTILTLIIMLFFPNTMAGIGLSFLIYLPLIYFLFLCVGFMLTPKDEIDSLFKMAKGLL